MTEHIYSTLDALEALRRQHDLTLLKLGEPLLSSDDEVATGATHMPNQRTSDASAATDQQSSIPTPTSLSADLTHYRDLFTKLRFSYTEQVTKEKFLRYLVSSPPPTPEHISPAANAELESQLAEIKDTLKQQKAAVDNQLAQIEARARYLAKRHCDLETQVQELRQLPAELERVQAEVQEMRKEQDIAGVVGDGQAERRMGLEATVNLVEEREEQLERVQRRLEQVIEQKTRKEGELRKLQDDVAVSERERDKAVSAAQDAKRRQQDGKSGVGDEVEDRGRWLAGVETTMRRLLGVEG